MAIDTEKSGLSFLISAYAEQIYENMYLKNVSHYHPLLTEYSDPTNIQINVAISCVHIFLNRKQF